MRQHEGTGTEVVDGLRGFAILWVLCYHTWLFSWYTPSLKAFGIDLPVDVLPRVGYLGVELFFFVSGFCLFVPYARHAVSGVHRELPLRAFAWRRAVKIVPSYALALLVTAPLALAYVRGPATVWFALANHAAFLQNFFDDGLGKANSVFWSLAIEVQFYLIFPALAIAFKRAPAVTAAAMIASALAYRHAVAGCCLLQEAVIRQLPAYLDVFACGMFAAYAVTWLHARRIHGTRSRVVCTLAAAGVAVLTFALLQTCNAVQYTPSGRETWDLLGRTGLALLFCALTIASCFALRFWRAAIANPALVFLSLISYNVYLWHTLVLIWMWKHGVPHAMTANPHEDDHWKFAYIASGWIAVLGIATAMTYFFERPLLATIKPHPFAFTWGALRVRGPNGLRKDRASVRARPSIAKPETRT